MTLTRRVSSNLHQVLGFAKRSFSSFKFPSESLVSYRPRHPCLPLPEELNSYKMDCITIVVKLSDCIASRGKSILCADVFVPENKNVFYSRRNSFLFPLRWSWKKMDEDFLKVLKMFSATRSVVRVPDLDSKFKIAILVSKQDHCLVELLRGWQDGKLPVDITCVLSNHDRGSNTHVSHFLERNGIPYHYLHTTKENKREREILELVLDIDFLVLARYMQIFSGHFLRTYGKDVINIHHGLLPSFKGGHPSKHTFEAGVKLIGGKSLCD
ncbi:hypothetical protein SLA2020_458080 [Shorea laevis]